MKNSIEFYNTVTPHLIDVMEYSASSLKCSYMDENKEYFLDLENFTASSKGFSALLDDARCVWNTDDYDLIFSRNYVIGNKQALFSKTGIADENDVLGLAVQWYSPDSYERGVRNIGLLKNDSLPFEAEFKMEMKPGFFKGDIRLDTIVYLYKKGDIRNDFNATQSGTVLGVLEEATLSLDGTGSVFPIVVVNDKAKPLWWVEYANHLDPTIDKFVDENVSIVVNEAHPNYHLLKMDASVADSPLFSEILASALIIIIERAKADAGKDGWNYIMSNDGLQPGSIGAAIYFFYNSLEWHIDDVVLLSNDIREFLINNLGGISR